MFRCACPATTVASHGHLSLWSRRCSALAGPGDALFAFLDVDRVRIFFEVDYSTMRSSGTRLMRATLRSRAACSQSLLRKNTDV